MCGPYSLTAHIVENRPDCEGKLRLIACVEEPFLIRKVFAYVQAREDLAGLTARAPPMFEPRESELFRWTRGSGGVGGIVSWNGSA